MQVKQLIKSSGRAAAGTLQASHQAERTLGEKLVCRAGRVEQKKKSRARCQPQPNSGRNRQLARTIARHFNKMKTRHDPKIRSNRKTQESLRIQYSSPPDEGKPALRLKILEP